MILFEHGSSATFSSIFMCGFSTFTRGKLFQHSGSSYHAKIIEFDDIWSIGLWASWIHRVKNKSPNVFGLQPANQIVMGQGLSPALGLCFLEDPKPVLWRRAYRYDIMLKLTKCPSMTICPKSKCPNDTLPKYSKALISTHDGTRKKPH